MKILHVLNHLTYGGIEVMLLHAIPHLQKQGYQIDLCCLASESHLDEEVRRLGCTIHRIKKSANPYRTANELQTLLTKHPYDLVHSHFGYTSGGLALAAKRLSIPFINSIHAASPTALEQWNKFPLTVIKHAWLSLHRRLMEENVTLFLGHSKANLNAFSPDWKEASSSYKLVYNGIMAPIKISPAIVPKNRPIFLHVGSFRPAKNHDYLLLIFMKILKEEREALLICVGDGDGRSEIERKAEALGLSRKILFTGALSDPWPYYAAADLFLFPSKSEGLANAIIEAQTAGLPLAASNIPAHRESVAPDQHHALFPLDNPNMAASIAVRQLRESKGVRASQKYVQKEFSIERFSNELGEIYQANSGCISPVSDLSTGCLVPIRHAGTPPTIE